jgi:hypothetical protein
MPGGYVEYNGKVYETSNVAAFLEDNPGSVIYLGDLPSIETKPGKTSLGKAVGLGAAQGASAGFSEEAEGAIDYALTKAGRFSELTKSQKADEPKDLSDYIGAARKKYTKAAKDQPVAYYGADVAAGLPLGYLIPGANIKRARDITKLAPVAGAGFVEGVGRTEGGLKERATGGAIGAGTMTVLPPALSALASNRVGRGVIGAGLGYMAAEGLEGVIPGEHGKDLSGYGLAIGALLGLAPNTVLRIYSRIKGAGKSPTVKATLDEFLDASPKGAELRLRAQQGEEAAEQALEEIQSRLTTMLEMEDQIQAYAHTGMKPEYIDKAMTIDWVDTITAPEMAKRALEPDVVYKPYERFAEKLSRKEQVQKQWGTPSSLRTPDYDRMPPMQLLKHTKDLDLQDIERMRAEGMSNSDIIAKHGRKSLTTTSPKTEIFENRQQLARRNLEKTYSTAHQLADQADEFANDLMDAGLKSFGKKIKSDVKKIYARFKKESVEGMNVGSHDKAEVFIEIDKLKRRIWSTAKSLERSTDSNSGALAIEAWDVGTVLQRNLEDGKVWGQAAANLQKEVNQAWHPYLTVRRPAPGERGFSRFETYMGAEPSKRIGRTRPEGDPRTIRTMVESLGEPEGDMLEKSFRKGVGTSADLGEALAKSYGNDPELMRKAAKMREEQQAMEALLGNTKDKLGAFRKRQALDKTGGPLKPSTVIRGMTASEELARSEPMRVIGRGASGVRKAAAYNPSNIASVDVIKQMWGDRPISTLADEEGMSKRDPRLESALRVRSYRQNTTNPKINNNP